MKRIILASLAVIGLMVLPTVALATAPDKVLVCHAAGQEGTLTYVTIEVPANEGGFPQGHFTEGGTTAAGHEDDYLGACIEEPTPTATATEEEPTPTATATEVEPTPTATATEPQATPTDQPTESLPNSDTIDPTDGPQGGNPLPLLSILGLMGSAGLALLKLIPNKG